MVGVRFEVKLPDWKRVDNSVKSAIATGLYRAAHRVRMEWIEQAGRVLTTSYIPYVTGLQHPRAISDIKMETATTMSISVGLVTPLSRMFEKGFPAFDMKPGLLKGRPYRRIAIPIRTPGTGSGVAVGVKSVIPPSIYARIKGRFEPGATIHASATLPPGVTGREIIRTRRQYGVYKIFRTVSNKPSVPKRPLEVAFAIGGLPMLRWWHPGYRGAHIRVTLLPRVYQIAAEELKTAFRVSVT